MLSNYYNFYYDPARQGYDTTQWHTIFGTPVIAGTSIQLQNAGMVHYGDIVRGQFQFNINVPSSPTQGNSRNWGLMRINTNAYIYFAINDTNFTANAADGNGNVSTTPITWNTAWAGTYQQYVIRWEGGTAKFFINGTQVAVITNIAVSGDPLSLYAANATTDGMLISTFVAKGMQSYWLNTEGTGTIFPSYQLFVSDDPTESDVLTVITEGEGAMSISDTETATEGITMLGIYQPIVNDTPTKTEVVSITRFSNISVSDTETATDVVTSI